MRLSPVCSSVSDGGAERYLRRLYALLSERGHRVELIGGIPRWSLDCQPAGLGPKWSAKTFLSSLGRVRAERASIRSVIGETDSELFHCQFKREQVALTDLLARKAPVVWTEHGTFKRSMSTRLMLPAYVRAARYVSAIVCVSNSVRDDLATMLMSDERLVVIPNAVDSSQMRPANDDERESARASLGLPRHGPVVAWVGRMHSDKAPLAAIHAGSHFPGHMVLAGGGPEAANVEQAAKGLANVHYVGRFDDPSPIYRAADVFLFTSRVGEGLPFTVLEAASFGLPIVASGAHLALSSSAGIILSAESDLARALQRALENRAELGQRNRDWVVAAHDEQQWLDKHERLFRLVAERNE